MKFKNLKDLENSIPKPGSFKHALRKIEEDGRIVQGVNTTDDVGPNEIKIQTAKFGNTVDKDGRPPTLSKKVRGSSTNVLFNLKEHIESVDKSDDHVLQYTMLEAKLGEIASASKIYVDMDGVLADFFGEWAKLMQVDHYSKIDDIDINVALQKIRDTEQFWLDLPLLPQAKDLLGLIKKVKGEYYICSTPLADDPKSEPHKREWIKKNLAFFPPKGVYITHNKPQYAKNKDGTPNILIDDFGKNVDAWDAAGGTGFKYKDHKFERTAKELQQHMNEPVEEGNLLKNPKNAFITKADTAYDFIKIGTNMANLKDMPTGAGNYDEPDIMIAPYAGRKEMKYLQKELKRLGYKTQDAAGYQDAHYDEKPTRGKAPPQVKGEGKLGRLKLSKMRSVQKKRKFKKLFNQLKRMGEDIMSPITVDKHGHIVNGHHRYDALRLMGEEYATVRMLDVHVNETMQEGWMTEAKGKCPPATQDLELNTKNRDATLKNFNYGPLNVSEPGDYWEKIAKYWKTDVKAALASNCGNCVAFDISPRMDDCMPGETSDEDGRLGYCWMHHFKCHSARSCHTWAKGGPIEDDEKSLDWQKRGEDKVEENFADGKKKGKSRPGRVKKSGASCNGSVTQLRKRAKNASGEKAKMYHWCANMKSGRKKK